MTGGIIKHELALQFIFGGKSFVTCLNTKTDNRFTFKVVKHKKDDIFFVNVLTGPDTYTFIGSVRNGIYKHSPKSNITSEAQSVKVFAYIINKLKSNNLPDFIEIYHDGRCGKCGRQLTVPESIETGFGPECAKNLSKQIIRDLKINKILK
jgi:hypothetical protein